MNPNVGSGVMITFTSQTGKCVGKPQLRQLIGKGSMGKTTIERELQGVIFIHKMGQVHDGTM